MSSHMESKELRKPSNPAAIGLDWMTCDRESTDMVKSTQKAADRQGGRRCACALAQVSYLEGMGNRERNAKQTRRWRG